MVFGTREVNLIRNSRRLPVPVALFCQVSSELQQPDGQDGHEVKHSNSRSQLQALSKDSKSYDIEPSSIRRLLLTQQDLERAPRYRCPRRPNSPLIMSVQGRQHWLTYLLTQIAPIVFEDITTNTIRNP